MRRFVFDDGKSHKFWEITVQGATHTVRYGKVGTQGQSKDKSFETLEQAQSDADKLIKSKIKKGYEEQPLDQDEGPNADPMSPPEAAAQACTHFSYLADAPGYDAVVQSIFSRVTQIRTEGDHQVFVFDDEHALFASPPEDAAYSEWPESFRRLAAVHGSLGFPDQDGWNLSLRTGMDVEADWLADDDVPAGTAIRSPIQDYSDWWLYHPAEMDRDGEPMLGFLSHEGGGFDGAPGMKPGAVFLQLLVRGLELDDQIELPQVDGASQSSPSEVLAHKEWIWTLKDGKATEMGPGIYRQEHDAVVAMTAKTFPPNYAALIDISDPISPIIGEPLELDVRGRTDKRWSHDGTAAVLLTETGYVRVTASDDKLQATDVSLQSHSQAAACVHDGKLVFLRSAHNAHQQHLKSRDSNIEVSTEAPSYGDAPDARPFVSGADRDDPGTFTDGVWIQGLGPQPPVRVVPPLDDPRDVVVVGKTVWVVGQKWLACFAFNGEEQAHFQGSMRIHFTDPRLVDAGDGEHVLVVRRTYAEKHGLLVASTENGKPHKVVELLEETRINAWTQVGDKLWVLAEPAKGLLRLVEIQLAGADTKELRSFELPFDKDNYSDWQKPMWLAVREGVAAIQFKTGRYLALRI